MGRRVLVAGSWLGWEDRGMDDETTAPDLDELTALAHQLMDLARAGHEQRLRRTSTRAPRST